MHEGNTREIMRMSEDFRRHAEGGKNSMNIRTTFYGKSYVYKDKVIGVCNTLSDDVFMIGHIKPSGSLHRVKILPLFLKADEAQKKLDEFASSRGLTEAAE